MAKARGGNGGPEQGQSESEKQLRILERRMDKIEKRFSHIVAGSYKKVNVEPDTKEDPSTRTRLPLDGGGGYAVIDPYFNYRGKSYSEWASDWFNWFVSVDADKRTFGPVVFLRSKGLPSKSTGANMS